MQKLFLINTFHQYEEIIITIIDLPGIKPNQIFENLNYTSGFQSAPPSHKL